MNIFTVKVLLATMALALLYACTAPGSREGEALPITETLRLASNAYQRWEQHNNVNALREAQLYYRRAVSVLPDNVNLQKVYYRCLYQLAILDWPNWHNELESHFNNVNPLIKSSLSPPRLLYYNYLYRQRASVTEQIDALKAAVKEQPHSSRAWYVLSTKYERSKQWHLALYAAKRAYDIYSDSPVLAFQVGDIYDGLAVEQVCIYEPVEYSKKSVQFMTKAVALKADEYRYQSSLAVLYNRLGLYPLALQVAKKAVALNAEPWAIEVLGQAYLNMGQYDKAEQQLQRLGDDYAGGWVNTARAIVAASDNQWQQAQQLLARNAASPNITIYSRLVGNWVDAINDPKPGRKITVWSKPQNPWESALIAYFNQHTDRSYLVDRSSDVCEATEAHFYTAMRLWIEGETAASQQHLQEVLKLNAFAFNEYLWAKVLLGSELFEHAGR